MSGKIYFKHGTMNSGKSLDLIRTHYNYTERDMNCIVFKPAIDNRDGVTVVKSRTGSQVDCLNYIGKEQLIELIGKQKIDAILFDECQFLKESDIDDIQEICYTYNIPIIFYGLKVDFQSHLFPATKRIIEIADDVQECIGICSCGKRAKQNLRMLNGHPVFDGELIQIGGNESYVALCNRCYFNLKRKML